jgi:restriction system protein
MARRKTTLLDEIASLPWFVGVALGVAAFFFVRSIGGVLAPLAWMFLLGCWAAAGVSYLNGRKRKALLETQTGLDSLTRMSWREFEMLVGEAFRRRGYFVEETGLGGKDGGVDLVLSKAGRKELVQCKQWRSRLVRASTVREMWGLAAHHGADAVHIACIGDFTPDAREFARRKPIQLITGEELLRLIQEVQQGTAVGDTPLQPTTPPTPLEVSQRPLCPACATVMTERRNRRTGAAFWRCPHYPRCRGTRPA